jgi:hypothetical protein
MALRFLLKNKSKGGMSLGEIGVISPIKMTLELGFPKLDYKGFNEAIGESISVDSFFSVVLVADLVGVEGGASCPCFRKASNWDVSWGPSGFDNEAFNSWVITLELFGVYSIPCLLDFSDSKPRGVDPCAGEVAIDSPCNIFGKLFICVFGNWGSHPVDLGTRLGIYSTPPHKTWIP